MRRTYNKIAIICVLATCLLTILVGPVWARENLFVSSIERSVDQAIAAWARGDSPVLKEAIKRLTLNETYLLVTTYAKATEKSYLSFVPSELTRNLNCVAAYLYLIKQDREGVKLWPRSLFEGKQFTVKVKGGLRWKQ